MIRLRQDAPPLAEAEVNAILAQLNLPAAKGGGIFSKLFASGKSKN
jgi:hypothetical protein